MINSTLSVTLDNKFEQNGWKIREVDLSLLPVKRTSCYIGIDVGTTNMGFCVFHNGVAKTFQARFVRDENPVTRMINVQILLDYLWGHSNFMGGNSYNYEYKVCVEGASFGDVYRQVELAEVRACSALWAIGKFGDDSTVIVPPLKIRKKVFGNGSIKGKELWKDFLPGDSADALGCAYYFV